MTISVYVGKKEVIWRNSLNCHGRKNRATAPLSHLDKSLMITSALLFFFKNDGENSGVFGFFN